MLESPGFFPRFSRLWKVLENQFGPGKSWKWKLEVLESTGKWRSWIFDEFTVHISSTPTLCQCYFHRAQQQETAVGLTVLQMVYEMTKILMESEPEQSHLRSGIGQLILIDRGLITSLLCCSRNSCKFLIFLLNSAPLGLLEHSSSCCCSNPNEGTLLLYMLCRLMYWHMLLIYTKQLPVSGLCMMFRHWCKL